MPTTKERILVTLTPDMARALKERAKRERSPKATIAARLMREALEDREDRYFSALAKERRASLKKGKLYPHEEVWKHLKTRKKK